VASTPAAIQRFLAGHRLAVAGVSRQGNQPANAIFRRLRDTGHEVVPINPQASQVEGAPCYHDVASVPGTLDGVMIVTAPAASVEVVRQCAARGVPRVWFHRSVGDGSVSPEAVREAEARGIEAIVGGCPLMFCGEVDVAHRCMRWWLQRSGKVPR
jgi:predicted CoA-binding protein